MPYPAFRLAPVTLAVMLALSTHVGGNLVYAQTAAPTIRIALPAQSLGTALNELARQASLQLMVAPDLVAGKSAPAVSGQLTVRQALDRLLEGNGLAADINGSEVIVRRASNVSAETTLPAVTVSGAHDATTEGSESYTTRSMNTATGLALSLRETPQSVTVVTRKQMDDQGLTDIASVLERTTGITRNQNESDRTYFSARGFDITKVQYDGLPSRDYYDYDSDVLAGTSVYDRIEIVRGATGLLSGTGEPSATINFVRKRPTSEFQGQAQLGVGSWNAVRGEIDLSGPLSDDGKIRGRIVATHSDRESYLDYYRKKSDSLYGVIEFDLSSDTLLRLGLDYEKSQTRGVTYGAPVPVFYADGAGTNFSRSTSTAADWTSLDRERLASFASLEKTLGSAWKARVNYAYRTSEAGPKLQYMFGYPDRATGVGVGAFFSSYDIEHRAHALDMQVSGPFNFMGREHELVIGSAYYKRNLDYKWHPTLSSVALDSFYNRAVYPAPVFGSGYSRTREQETVEKSVYVSSRWNLAEELKLILGTRWTSADYNQISSGTVTSSKYSGELTPYAGLVYDFSKNYSAYISYTDVFETQTNKDRNDALLPPRTGTNYEAGLKGELLDGRLNVSAAIFKVKQDNLAEFDTVVDGENRYRPIMGAVVEGYELEVSGEISPRWNLAAGFTRRSAEDATGEELQTVVPRNLFRLTSSHKLSGIWSAFSVGGHFTWQSQLYEKAIGPNGEDAIQPSYGLIHLFSTYQADKNLSFHLAINNLFDKKYYTSITNRYGRYGDPRNATVTMKYRF